MSFTLRPGLVCFTDNKPGNHATMFVDGTKLRFREDASSFNDAAKAYTWAFEWSGVPDGQTFVFATADREVAGIAKDANVGVVPFKDYVVRQDGKPHAIGVASPRADAIDLGGKPRRGKLVTLATTTTPKPTHAARCMFVNPVIPYNQWACYKPGVMNEASFSAHGSAYVSAALKNHGHSTFLVDFRSMNSWAHVEDVLRKQEYDVAFVGFLSIDVFHAAAAVRLLKELHPNRPVVVGGLHVSIAKERIFPRPDLVDYYTWGNQDLLPDSFKQFLAFKGESHYIPERYPQADYVILDDGEIAAQNLVAELAAGRRPSERTIDGGAVPMEIARHMDRDLFRLDFEAHSPILPFQPTPMVTVTWARGCPFHCRYCFTPGMIVHTEYGFEEIATVVRRGEPVRVVQADGNLGRAATFSERPYRGSIVRINTHYMNQPIEATPNHKIKIRTTGGLWADKTVEDLTLGDRLFVPTPRGESIPILDVEALLREAGEEPQRIGATVRLRNGKNSIAAHIPWTDDLLFLLGIYIAEGCVTYAKDRPNSLAMVFTFGGHERHLQEKVIQLIEKVFGVEAKPVDQRTGIQVWCGISVVAKIFEYLCGPASAEKKLHRWLLGLSNEKFLKIATAWLVGDGNPGAENTPHSYTSGTTVSASLAWGLWTRLLGAGVAVGLHKKKRPAACSEIEGRAVEVEEFYYDISFHHSEGAALLAREAFGERGRVPSRLTFPLEFCEGGALLPIKSLESVYCKDPVFNMEVTPDHTYTVNGCAVHNCNLASQLSNTNVREKPVELVEEELDDLHQRFGGRIGSLMIHDDLTFHPKHISQWCELILRKYGPIPIWMQTRADWVVTRYRRDRPFWELLCRAGLTWVSVGYESGSQRVLDYMRKDNTVENNIECGRILDEYGISSFGNFLWGVPTETHEEAEATVELVKKIKPGFLSGSIYCNYPGTQLDAECREKGHLIGGTVYARSHLPWQVTVKGIDYEHKNDCVRRAGAYANYLRMPKLLSPDRQRDLAATSRGLPIHTAGEG